jgi:hypothetical protein
MHVLILANIVIPNDLLDGIIDQGDGPLSDEGASPERGQIRVVPPPAI